MQTMTVGVVIRRFFCYSVPGLLVVLAECGVACEPESYFLFRSEAQNRLDSLNVHSSSENAFERLVLMHNLAFHKDKQLRERAEKLLEKEFPKKSRTPIVRAYAGSLKMIRVSQRTTGSKVIRTINPLTKSPYAEGREGFKQISEAVGSDTSNPILRILRATAAAESAEHLNELFDSARIDLEWLQAHKEPTDSVCQFLIYLNWAKYYYKMAKMNPGESDVITAERHIKIATAYACTPVYREWANEWRSKIDALRETMKDSN
jgi:hypothetical protein